MVVGLTDVRLLQCLDISDKIPGLPNSLALLANPLTKKPFIVGTLDLRSKDESTKENINYFSVMEHLAPVVEDLTYLCS